jgi:hypothetical protein
MRDLGRVADAHQFADARDERCGGERERVIVTLSAAMV